MAVVGYDSMLSQQQETIKIEVSLREPLLTPAVNGKAQTLLRNPLTNSPMIAPIGLRSIDKTEALAEKFRAALSRREPAVRDFFDIDYAIRKDGLRPDAEEFIDQVGRKLGIPGNDPLDVSERRLAARGTSRFFTWRTASVRGGDSGSQTVSDQVHGGNARSLGCAGLPTE